jgi:hypothetical protein
VYRSRPVSDSLDPTWDIGEIDLASICNGDLVRAVRAPLVFYTLIPILEPSQPTDMQLSPGLPRTNLFV